MAHLGFGQLKSLVINSETKEKIPFVNIWVENENIGTTSNQQGIFELAIKTPQIIIFSAIGYETKRIPSDSITDVVALSPSAIQLDEFLIIAHKKDLTRSIGDFKKSSINHYFVCGSSPWIAARYFPYEEKYNQTRKLEEIKILTRSSINDAKFNVRLYSVNEAGEPGQYIHDQNIIGTASKGKKVTKIDLSNLNIELPKEGLFIAIEWLIIDDNRYESTYTDQKSKKKIKSVSYEPAIGTLPVETAENSWLYIQGRWKNVSQITGLSSDSYRNKYNLLAIELTLTN